MTAGAPSIHSAGTFPPHTTPTPKFYASCIPVPPSPGENGEVDPNIYVVQPFKQQSVPKDMVYRTNVVNPAESLLHSTIELINHFSSCYESLKHQLQHEARAKGGNNNGRPRQGRLRPLMINHSTGGPQINACVGIAPVPAAKANDLTIVYEEKLRRLKKMRPELFDKNGSLISTNTTSHRTSVLSSKKSESSFRTPYNTIRTENNGAFDDRRTFLTEFSAEDDIEEEQNGGGDHQERVEDGKAEKPPLQQSETEKVNNYLNSNETMRNYVIKLVEIKKRPTSAATTTVTSNTNKFNTKFHRGTTAKSS